MNCTKCTGSCANPGLQCSPSYATNGGLCTINGCTSGSFCLQGLSIACPLGRYTPSSPGSSFCIPVNCSSGYYAASTASSICSICSVGYACNNSFAYPCVSGSYSDTPAQSSCTICNAPPGKYCTATQANIECVQAGAQRFCPGGRRVPQPCECLPGTFCNTAGGDSNAFINGTCIICPENSFCVGGDRPAEDCATAPNGYAGGGFWCPKGSSKPKQEPCPMGFYCPPGQSTPIPCNSCNGGGKYCPAGLLVEICLDCSAGRYCPGIPLAVSLPCNTSTTLPGYYCPSSGSQSSGLECPAGFYCMGESTMPIPCPPGTYSSNVGSANCTLCSIGFYATSLQQQSCTPCPIGYFGRHNISIWAPVRTSLSNACEQCPLGTMSTLVGATSSDVCIPCPAGTYGIATSVGISITTCIPCPTGTYNDNLRATSINDCLSCPMGYACPAGSTTPIPCPVGTFGNSINLGSILQCTECTSGFYCSESAMTLPKNCPVGFYCAGMRTTQPTACPRGRFSVSENSTSLTDGCHLCPAGTYSIFSGTTDACQECPIGMYSMMVGASQAHTCQFCPVGRYANSTGTSSCHFCPAGRFSETLGGTSLLSSCRKCNDGYYDLRIRTNASVDLSVMSILQEFLLQHQIWNEAPSTFLGGNTDTTVVNEYNKLSRENVAQILSHTYIDHFVNIMRSNEADTTNRDDFLQKYLTNSRCFPCAIGRYFTGHAVGIHGSVITILSSELNDTMALTAAINLQTLVDNVQFVSYTPYTLISTWLSIWLIISTSVSSNMISNMTSESIHLTNKTTDILSNVCRLVERGHVSSNEGVTKQATCLDGFVSNFGIYGGPYHNGLGSYTCILCNLGQFSTNSSSTECFNCPAGKIGEPSRKTCQPCNLGTYSSTHSSTTCTVCDVGQNSSLVSSSTSCIDCPAGRYMPSTLTLNVLTLRECIPCPRGTYTSSAKSSTCNLCEAGRWSDYLGNNIGCTACEPGRFGVIQGQDSSTASCSACPAGTFSDGLTICKECPMGRYNSLIAQATISSCIACEEFADCPSGSTVPSTTCPLGFYINRTISEAGTINKCTPCPAGFACPMTNIISMKICPIGAYCPQGSIHPISCPITTWSNHTGSSNVSLHCHSCSEGWICSGDFNIPPEQCPIGRYVSSLPSNSSIITFCKPCEAGTAKSSLASIQCTACAEGFSTNGEIGLTSCLACAPGSFSNSTSSPTCQLCPFGTFAYRRGSNNCYPCPRSGDIMFWLNDSTVDGDQETLANLPVVSQEEMYVCLQGSSLPLLFSSSAGVNTDTNHVQWVDALRTTIDVRDPEQSTVFPDGSSYFATIKDNRIDELRDNDEKRAEETILAVALTGSFGLAVLLLLYWICRRNSKYRKSCCKMLMIELDMFPTSHYIPDGSPVFKRPKALGGCFTAAAFVIIIIYGAVVFVGNRYIPPYSSGLTSERPSIKPYGLWQVGVKFIGDPTCQARSLDEKNNPEKMQERLMLDGLHSIGDDATNRLVGNITQGIVVTPIYTTSNHVIGTECTYKWSCDHCYSSNADAISIRFEITNAWANAIDVELVLPPLTRRNHVKGDGSQHKVNVKIIPDRLGRVVFHSPWALLEDRVTFDNSFEQLETATQLDFSLTTLEVIPKEDNIWVGNKARVDGLILGKTVTTDEKITSRGALRFVVRLSYDSSTAVYQANRQKSEYVFAAIFAPWSIIMGMVLFIMKVIEWSRRSPMAIRMISTIRTLCCGSCSHSRCCQRYCSKLIGKNDLPHSPPPDISMKTPDTPRPSSITMLDIRTTSTSIVV